MRLSLKRIIFRSWFYWRVGYGTYIALLLGVASNLVVLYRLGIVDIKFLALIFPSLGLFSLAAIVVAAPVGIGIGYYHMKRTAAYAADASVSIEANPYTYKVMPGKEQEVLYPLIMLTAKGLAKVLDKENMLSQSEKKELDVALAKASALLEGAPIGHPSRPRPELVPENEETE